jgi:hypothetical protein
MDFYISSPSTHDIADTTEKDNPYIRSAPVKTLDITMKLAQGTPLV